MKKEIVDFYQMSKQLHKDLQQYRGEQGQLEIIKMYLMSAYDCAKYPPFEIDDADCDGYVGPRVNDE